MLFAPSLQCKHWLGPACTILAEACAAILRKLPRVPAPGLSDWKYEHICAAATATQPGSEAELSPINTLLSGCCPLCWIAGCGSDWPPKSKSSRRPILVSETWHQLAALLRYGMLCCSEAAGPVFTPLQDGVRVSGDGNCVPQRFRRGWKRMRTASPLRWTTAMRDIALLEADQRAPQLVPFIQWTYSSKQGLLSRECSSIRSCKSSFVSSTANHAQLNAFLSGAARSARADRAVVP
jgi:hypothetical protein